jgi:F-type H+-transporting ATPase subunit gamma
MASLKDLRRRIRSTKSTQQITKAMEMVAASKLRRAQARAVAARPYAAKLTEMLQNLAGAASELENPLFQSREVKTTALVVISAERGLCGAYNTNVIRAAELRMRAAKAGTAGDTRLILVGKKSREYFKRRTYPVLATYADNPAEANLEFARKLTQDLIELFVAGTVDRVEVQYTQFISALNRRIVTEVFLPVGGGEVGKAPQDRGTIFEPNPEAIFEELLPRYASAKMFAAIADALASEHSSRMIAMGAARKNAGELVDSLTLLRNRMRQAAITKEISEIVGGAEALR